MVRPILCSGLNNDLSKPLVEGHHQQHWTEPLRIISNTEQYQCPDMYSLNHHQSKFSLFLYNHDNGTFTQLANSVLRFQQSATRFGGDGARLRRSCNNIDLPMVVPTQNIFDQFAAWTSTIR
ncbi:hypothetical protein EUTSA_v10027361mg [Eutrema salsugineum]|uniref:Uncharacterized protein n=1 Tax=Eutrema salsugineum TaxID=72664 RepID=V4MII8_EUTSA|nr:hypothetical protein EUTSA_v10027361mg [Eutrema salsugineum]